MPQMLVAENVHGFVNTHSQLSTGIVFFFPFIFQDNISLNTLNIPFRLDFATNSTLSLSLGLYSLTGSSLSIANSLSATAAGVSDGNSARYVSFTNTSAAQNITPGVWWWAFLVSSATNVSYFNHFTGIPGNSFPGAFIGGRMTASSAALPASVATSDLDITGSDAMNVPLIIVSA